MQLTLFKWDYSAVICCDLQACYLSGSANEEYSILNWGFIAGFIELSLSRVDESRTTIDISGVRSVDFESLCVKEPEIAGISGDFMVASS